MSIWPFIVFARTIFLLSVSWGIFCLINRRYSENSLRTALFYLIIFKISLIISFVLRLYHSFSKVLMRTIAASIDYTRQWANYYFTCLISTTVLKLWNVTFQKNVPKNELKYFKLINAFVVSMVYGLQFVY